MADTSPSRFQLGLSTNRARELRKNMKTKEITPRKARCVGIGCAAIFKTDRGTRIVVGQVPAMKELPREVLEKLSSGYVAVEVPSAVLKHQ